VPHFNSITNDLGGSLRIDVHNHAMPEPALELLRSEPLYGVTLTGRRWSGGKHVDFEIAPSFVEPDAKLDELARKELDAAVISVIPPLFYYHVAGDPGEAMARAVNEGLAGFCTAAPDRLRWLATLPMQAPDRAVAVLEDAVAAGCVGVEIGTTIVDRRLDETDFEQFWAAAERLGLPVTLHPAYTEGINPALAPFYLENVLGFLFDTTIAIERLIIAGILDRHPELRLVLLHGGGYFPYQAGRLRHARTVRPELAEAPADPWAYLDRLSFDIITHDPLALRYLISRVGSGRVVMGTDLPFDMATPEPMELLRAAADDETARAIAEHNPAALYGFN
jgi:aminocarboxymuconate-semialdehyde decarboxylase